MPARPRVAPADGSPFAKFIFGMAAGRKSIPVAVAFSVLGPLGLFYVSFLNGVAGLIVVPYAARALGFGMANALGASQDSGSRRPAHTPRWASRRRAAMIDHGTVMTQQKATAIGLNVLASLSIGSDRGVRARRGLPVMARRMGAVVLAGFVVARPIRPALEVRELLVVKRASRHSAPRPARSPSR